MHPDIPVLSNAYENIARNMLITTAMMSGFKPELMKSLLLVYTLVCDAWVLFAFYFVSFSLTYVVCSLFRGE